MLNDLRKITTRVRLPSHGWNPIFIPYIPIGFMIVLLRIFIFFHAYVTSAVLLTFPFIKKIVLRLMSISLGFIISVDNKSSSTTTLAGEEEEIDRTTVIVSNHVSLFDHLLLDIVTPCFTIQPNLFRWAFRTADLNLRTATLDDIVSLNRRKCGHLHYLADDLPTGSSDVMLRWDSQLLKEVNKIRPVAIHVHRHFPVSLVVYPLDWRMELFWQLFTPFTFYRLELLPVMSRKESESSDDFISRVRSALSVSLHARPLHANADDLLSLSHNTLTPPIGRHDSANKTSTSTSLASSSAPSHFLSSTSNQQIRYRGHSGGFPTSSSVLQAATSSTTPSQQQQQQRSAVVSESVKQILEVLPDVNIRKIEEALERSEDVHAAIAYLLDDGTVDESAGSSVVPVNQKQQATSAISSTTSPSSSSAATTELQERLTSSGTLGKYVEPSSYRACASSFGQSAQARQMSFADRKAQFIENARQVYLLKQNKSSP